MAPTAYDLRTQSKSDRNSGTRNSAREKSSRERGRGGGGLGLNCSADFCRGVVAECLGTFFFMIVACTADLRWDSSVRVDVLKLSLTLGLAVVTLVHCFEHISGAQLNPAVTASLMIIRQTGLVKGMFFIAAQFLGASIAVLLLKGFLPTSILGNMGYTVVSPLITAHQAMGLEVLMSFLFVFTVVSSMEATRFASKLVGLPIGLAFLLNTLWGYEFTGASMNPARSISAAIIQGNTDDWPVILEVYLAGPVAGGLVAALIYKFIFDPTFVPGSMRSFRSTSQFDSEEDSMIAMQPVSPQRKEDRGTRGVV